MIHFIENIDVFNGMLAVELHQYYTDVIIFILTAICFVYLFVSEKELRYKFLLPIAAILFIIWNPVIYIFILRGNAYWRMFWMIPNSVILGMTVVSFLRKRENVWMKWGAVALLAVVLMLGGKNVFKEQHFTPAENWEKVSQDTKDICDIMLELDERPRAIVSENLFSEIRQYAPKISLMYGRNAHNYIGEIDSDNWKTYWFIESEKPMYDLALPLIVSGEYSFIVVELERPIEEDLLEIYEFREVDRNLKYIIYYNGEIKHVPENDK